MQCRSCCGVLQFVQKSPPPAQFRTPQTRVVYLLASWSCRHALERLARKPAFDVLPDEDVWLLLLTTANVQIIYLPTNEHESFYSIIMLDKFQAVLLLTSLDRVVSGSDEAMLRGSLDYLCELSIAGKVQKNMVAREMDENPPTAVSLWSNPPSMRSNGSSKSFATRNCAARHCRILTLTALSVGGHVVHWQE
jgi:hypothetical protein